MIASLLFRLRDMLRDLVACWRWSRARRKGLPARRGDLDHRFTIHLLGPNDTNKLEMWGTCTVEEARRLMGFLGTYEEPPSAVIVRSTTFLRVVDTTVTLGALRGDMTEVGELRLESRTSDGPLNEMSKPLARWDQIELEELLEKEIAP
jgi:hypothetical protein